MACFLEKVSGGRRQNDESSQQRFPESLVCSSATSGTGDRGWPHTEKVPAGQGDSLAGGFMDAESELERHTYKVGDFG